MIEIDSEVGLGTITTIRLPLTLAIVQSLLVQSKEETFAIPLSSVIESIRISPSEIQKVGDSEVYKLRDKVLPLVHLRRSDLSKREPTPSSIEAEKKNVLERIRTDFSLSLLGMQIAPPELLWINFWTNKRC